MNYVNYPQFTHICLIYFRIYLKIQNRERKMQFFGVSIPLLISLLLATVLLFMGGARVAVGDGGANDTEILP